MPTPFSIIIPAYNCQDHLRRLLTQIQELDYDKSQLEVLVVDDGSTDQTASVAIEMGATLIQQEENMGRVITRERGAREAKHETLVFVDARCNIEKDLLKNAAKLNYLPLMGVGMSDKTLSIIDRVFYCIRKKVYHPYEPQIKYAESLWLKPGEFDGRPKGTGLLIIQRNMFLNCALEEKYQDVNDDTKLLHNIVHKGAPILRHTSLPFFYEHRHEWSQLLKHTFFRGPKFYDYYLVKEGPYFKYLLLGLILLVALIVLFILKPTILPTFFFTCALAPCIVALWMSEEVKDFFACLIFFPPVAFAFITGILFAFITRLLGNRELVKH